MGIAHYTVATPENQLMTLTEKCLAFSGLFEAELLIQLMLRYWSHPLAPDDEFRNALLEGAADVLRSCIAGQQLMEDIPSDQMNFVAAAWYVEWNNLSNGAPDPQG
jgi:hypothetical protein